MNKLIVRTGLLGLVTAAALSLGGCGNSLKEENAQLRENNAKLETEKSDALAKATAEQAARSDAEGRLAAAQGDITRLQTQIATMGTAGNGNGNTGGTPTREPRAPRGGSERIVVAGDVLFSPGSASLTAAGKKEIDKVISTIKSHHQGDTIRVEGYTDSDPIRKSSYGSNKALSQARAESVEKYMASKGVSASRISAVGMGAENPKATKAQSRRVEIVIVDTN
ncbi:MAG TPA: OmpA family protein [Phycisphaerales bacterium]|nr:OmpA family protein [Phycisphaerales bacterium]